MESLLKTIGTEFDYKNVAIVPDQAPTASATVLANDSELARKRLRIARLKK